LRVRLRRKKTWSPLQTATAPRAPWQLFNKVDDPRLPSVESWTKRWDQPKDLLW